MPHEDGPRDVTGFPVSVGDRATMEFDVVDISSATGTVTAEFGCENDVMLEAVDPLGTRPPQPAKRPCKITCDARWIRVKIAPQPQEPT